MTFNEFTKQFLTEEQCRNYLYQLRWPEGFICPKCGGDKSWKVREVLYECTKCKYQASVLAGTIFQDTRKPLQSWFTAIWWITTQKYGASAEGLQQILGLLSYETAWTWLHKIRKAMVNPNRAKLSGNVEIDEAYVGGVNTGGKSGRGSENKTLVVAAVEVKDKCMGRIRLNIIKDASGRSLKNFIVGNVEIGTNVITDAWKGYSRLEEKGYEREIYNQSQSTTGEQLLPNVHLVISLLKRWLLGTHHGAISPKHLQSYLDEFVFRFNRRTSAKRGLLFYRLLENAMETAPVTFDEITGKSSPESSR